MQTMNFKELLFSVTNMVWQRSIVLVTSMNGMEGVSLILALTSLTLAVWIATKRLRKTRIYMVDYSCYKPPEDRKMNTEMCEYVLRRQLPDPAFESVRFQVNVHIKSGMGQETYAPASFFNLKEDGGISNMTSSAWQEATEAFSGVLDRLFTSNRLNPAEDIDILIINVCSFSPEPSLTAWVVNRYGLKENIKTYNLSGMGCSAGLVGVSLAKDLLKVHSDSRALVLSTEIITVNRYLGSERSMMLCNCLFRVGGSAVLLSNKPKDAERARAELVYTVRTHLGRDEAAYKAIYQREDEGDFVGFELTTALIDAAGKAVKECLTALAPKVLPVSELLRYAVSVARRERPLYVPSFKKAFDLFCIHPGGRAVIGGIGKNLGLGDRDTEPALMTLHRFGNTSASGLWYEVAYMDAKGWTRPGDRLLQIALGSGFKSVTAVWRFIRSPRLGEYNVWSDCIDQYPTNTRNPFEKEYMQRFNIVSQQKKY